MADDKKEEILQYLEKEETACEKLDDLWRDKIDTTGITTVRQFFERFEKESGPLSLDDLKELLRDLAYVDITSKVFPHNSPQNKATGSLLNASVTSDLEATGGNNPDMSGLQSFPEVTMVTQTELQCRWPQNAPQPSSHDYDERSFENISGTVNNLEQELRKENDRLKVKVQRLEQELEREKAITHVQRQALNRHQQLVANYIIDVEEERKARTKAEENFIQLLKSQQQYIKDQSESRIKAVIQSLESKIQQNKQLEDRVLELQHLLELERIRHVSAKKELSREREKNANLQKEHEQIEMRVKQERQNLQQQFQQNIAHLEHQFQQDRKNLQQQYLQERENLQQQYQQERANLLQQYQQDCANLDQQYTQRIQQIQRAAEENCARHQQPEQRSWIIRRSDVSKSNNVLGQGSWGIVCKGTFRGSPVAVKQIHSEIMSHHNRALFEREMEIASRCRHPNLLQFMGATADDGNPLFITELLDCSLRDLLDVHQCKLKPQEVVSLALDVAKGLNYLHHNEPPILHRDIKSDNILLKRKGDGSWEAKVSDVGAANFVRLVMTPNQGAPIYSAPETATSHYTQKADVYSFGLLLLEMATRQMPAPVQQISAQIAQICCEPLESVIRDCVHQNPENRPSMDRVIGLLTQLTQ